MDAGSASTMGLVTPSKRVAISSSLNTVAVLLARAPSPDRKNMPSTRSAKSALDPKAAVSSGMRDDIFWAKATISFSPRLPIPKSDGFDATNSSPMSVSVNAMRTIALGGLRSSRHCSIMRPAASISASRSASFTFLPSSISCFFALCCSMTVKAASTSSGLVLLSSLCSSSQISDRSRLVPATCGFSLRNRSSCSARDPSGNSRFGKKTLRSRACSPYRSAPACAALKVA